ncbi:MAG: Phosphohistidine phosphatase SixA [Myxococcales bacterium]|nr:Phosphohistidine phosphatase SixA [Myxococcales bacterium]
MNLFVIRHAIAEDASPDLDDAHRELTDDGIRKLRQVVKGLRKLDISFDRVITSPWARALHTARLLAPITDELPIATDLLCVPPRAELLALIAERNEDTAVVGHEPWLSELVAWLAFADTRHGEAVLIKKAGLVWLEGSSVPGGMMVRALLPPRLIRAAR